MGKNELHCLAESSDIEPARPDTATRDAFDDLLEGSSLGSPAAQQIRNMTSADDMRRFHQRLNTSSRSAELQAADVDDAVLALVQMSNLTDSVDRASSRQQGETGNTVRIAQSRLPDPGRWLSPRLPFEVVLAQVMASFWNPVRDSSFSCRIWAVWTAIRLVQQLVARSDGPDRALQYLIDENVVADVREDVADAIVSIALSNLGTSSPIVLQACAIALENNPSLNDQIRQLIDSFAASPEILQKSEKSISARGQRSKSVSRHCDRAVSAAQKVNIFPLRAGRDPMSHADPYIAGLAVCGTAEKKNLSGLEGVAGDSVGLSDHGASPGSSDGDRKVDEVDEESSNSRPIMIMSVHVTGISAAALAVLRSLSSHIDDLFLSDLFRVAGDLQQHLGRANRRNYSYLLERPQKRRTIKADNRAMCLHGDDLRNQPLLICRRPGLVCPPSGQALWCSVGVVQETCFGVREEILMADLEVSVKPHGRILSVLGDIEFSLWQCLAELIDNAFDDFLDQGEFPDGRPTVNISLPSRDSDLRTAEVWVRDNGRGMDLETLGNAVRAGWTSNSRYGSLGLYGMGFNVATARLGRKTVIKTTRAGDPSWTVLTLDLVQLGRGDDYSVPVRFEPKDYPGEHGTQVIISELKRDKWEGLSKQGSKIREQLGDVYSYLLRERDFLITVNGKKVQPRLPCLWDKSRTVTRSGVTIPAVIEINRSMPPAKACKECGRWSPEWVEKCEDCQSVQLELRERRIWGWIGVQRYLHKTDYGIDFLRNGRKILIRDKRLFLWEDPNGIDEPDPEYPIDSRRGRGRFVGEIHCDHVPVNYQKNAFEYDGPEWRTVVRYVRGDSPLRERIAERLRLPRNNSHLALLYAGFRREDPGLNYLVPGDGKQALFDTAIVWTKKFRDGVSDYQSDQIWYDAAYQHDHPVVPEPDDEADDDILDEMGLGDGPQVDESDGHSATSPAVDPDPSLEETLDQRLSRYRGNATRVMDLSGRYEATDLGSVELAVWAVRDRSLLDPAGNTVPAFIQMVKAPRVEVFIAVNHPLFTEFGIEIRDLAMVELAEFMRLRATSMGRDPKALSAVLADIKSRATDQKITTDVLAGRASRLLDRIREAMQREVKGSPTGYWEMLQESDRALAQRRFVIEGGDDPWDVVVESGDFALFLPGSAVVHLLEKRPEAFLDGKVFKRPYLSLTDDSSRSLVVSRLVGFVSDLALMEEHQPKLGLMELHRVKLSCLLVESDLADTE